MTPSFLSRLGLLRWLAALMAVAYHVRSLVFAEYAQVQHKGPLLTLFYLVTSLGHEAIVVSMVGSGLLLGGLSWRRWQWRVTDPWADLWHRLGALYMLLLPVLLAGGILDLVGSTLLDSQGVYAGLAQFAPSHLGLVVLTGNLLLLQDILVPGFGSNAMLFLPAYEWWAYFLLVLFAGSRRGGAKRSLFAAAPLAVAAAWFAPGFLGLFAAWFAGLAVARYGGRLAGEMPASLGVALFFSALLASRVGGAHLHGAPQAAAVPGRIALDVLVALALAMLLLSLYGRVRTRQPGRAMRWPRVQRCLVRLSVPVYVAHFPVMVFMVAVATVVPGVSLHAQPSLPGFVLFAAVIGVAYLFAYLMQRTAGALQALLRRRSAVLAAASRVL